MTGSYEGGSMQVLLSCAAVATHGRAGLIAIAFAFLHAIAAAQTSSIPELSDLADKIAKSLGAGASASARIVTVEGSRDPAVVEREMTGLLIARGVRLAPAGTTPAAVVTISCGENLRERGCVADVARNDSHDIVSSTTAHAVSTAGGTSGPATVSAIEATPVFGQRAPILDLALIDDRLWILDPSALTLYRRSADEWRRVASGTITSPRPWPRDLRGRLRASGTAIEAFLPAVVCRAALDLAGFACAEQREPWPLAVENTGLDALRNTFQTPEGVNFFSAAAVGGNADVRAAIVDGSGRLMLLGDRRTPLGVVGAADDVASVTAGCSGSYVLTVARTPGAETDTIGLWDVTGRARRAAATPLVFPGRVTALWAADGAPAATAVVHDDAAGRYEAFQIRAVCDR
jgi:hypothetical protein